MGGGPQLAILRLFFLVQKVREDGVKEGTVLVVLLVAAPGRDGLWPCHVTADPLAVNFRRLTIVSFFFGSPDLVRIRRGLLFWGARVALSNCMLPPCIS